MAEVTEYKIQQIVDNGNVVQITLAENVNGAISHNLVLI